MTGGLNLTINTPTMPVKSSDVCVFDTSVDCNVKIVSHGSFLSCYEPLTDGTNISFATNILRGLAQIDERNLVNCQQLNLDRSSITSLCTKYLSNLRVLSLRYTKIRSIQTCNLRNIELLDISWTFIVELNTSFLDKIEQLYMTCAPISRIETQSMTRLQRLDL